MEGAYLADTQGNTARAVKLYGTGLQAIGEALAQPGVQGSGVTLLSMQLPCSSHAAPMQLPCSSHAAPMRHAAGPDSTSPCSAHNLLVSYSASVTFLCVYVLPPGLGPTADNVTAWRQDLGKWEGHVRDRWGRSIYPL